MIPEVSVGGEMRDPGAFGRWVVGRIAIECWSRVQVEYGMP